MNKFRLHIIIASLLYITFSFVVINTGFHFWIILFALLSLLIGALNSNKDSIDSRRWIYYFGIYFFTGFLILITSYSNNIIARNRFNLLISEINNFHEHEGNYPYSLSELVPNYISNIPKAMYTLTPVEFEYIKYDNGTRILLYNPFFIGRPIGHEFP